MIVRPIIASLAALALLAQAPAQVQVPTVTYDPAGTVIETLGEPGDILTVEAADSLTRPAWDLLSSFALTNRSARVLDAWCGGKPQRFYRVTQRTSASMLPMADNFRLIDQFGKSHELHYYAEAEDIKAFVLIFAANGCADLEKRLPSIKALQAKYGPQGVLFWMINSNPADTRASIGSEAERLGISFPVLHDRAQSVARVYGASSAGEVVCISGGAFEIIYRGALEEPSGSSPSRAYLDEALTALLSGRTPQTLAVKPSGCEIPLSAAGDITYSTAIAPLLQEKCVSCHSPGNVAPWAMTNHAIVKIFAPAIKEKVLAKQMPPWHADPEYGRFKNDISLSPAQEGQLIEWILAGAPRGTGPDPLENVPPPPPRWPAELGEPDLILRPPLQEIDATGVEPYRYIFVETGLKENTWLRAAIVRPTNTKVVHHYLVWQGRSMEQMASGLAGYVPGMPALAFPTNTGVLLAGNSSVTFNLHYTPSGEAETDQPELALWFHTKEPAKQIFSLPLPNLNFVIPAGAREHAVRADTKPLFDALPFPVTVYGMAAHMHLRGRSMRFEVEYPDGIRETLLSVPKYDFHWQTRYLLEEPKVLPKGTKVWLTGSFDNSRLNHANPNPGEEVRWGEQSWEEMFIGYWDITSDAP